MDWIEYSRLWLVLDRDAAAPRSLPEATAQCIEGGVDVVVFRMKDATAEEALPVAQEVRQVCFDLGAAFVLAHLIPIAKAVRPEAIHLGKGDKPERPWLDKGNTTLRSLRWGWSCHSVNEAINVIRDCPAYVFLGPIFDTPSKRSFGPPLAPEVIRQAIDCDRSETPFVFIGGMDEQTIPLAVQAGAKRVAAIRALLSVPDPAAAARRLRALLP